MSSSDAILDTTLAVARQLLNKPVPLHSPVMPNGTHFLQPEKPKKMEECWNIICRQQRKLEDESAGFSWQEAFDRWNVEFFPWQKIPVENPSE